jgi:hypothetical protein
MYASPNIIRVIKSRTMRWEGDVARMEEVRNAYKILVGKHEGKRSPERARRRWKGNIRTDLGKCGGKVWTGLIWLRIWTSGGLL